MSNIVFTILVFILFFFAILIGLIIIFNKITRMLISRNKQFSRRFYLKEIPLTLNYKIITHARIVGQFLGIVLLTAVISFTFF